MLYEDLRLEIRELRAIDEAYRATGKPIPEFRVIYFLRRALGTLCEFRRGLTAVRICAEFKDAKSGLNVLDARSIASADTFLQKNWQQIKDFRNEFGAHMQEAGVRFAAKNLDGIIGSITWNHGSNMGLECDFAAQIVAGAIVSKLPPSSDPKAEASKALQTVIEAFVHVQAAMCALAHAFLWTRFGK